MNIVLTGATSGIGWETFKSLWKDGHQLLLPVRNLDKAKKMLAGFGADSRVHLYTMDLAKLSSVAGAAAAIRKDFDRVDIIIANAGGMFPPGKLNEDGLDETFVVNHLGHFLFCNQLSTLLPSSTGKIISISSIAHKFAKVDSQDLGLHKPSTSFGAYAVAKLYNIWFTKGFRDHHTAQNIQCYALHPGAVKTAFGNDAGPIESAIIKLSKLFFISPKKGAQTTLFLANTPVKKLINGGYYDKQRLSATSSKANDMASVDLLWKYSEAEVKRILG